MLLFIYLLACGLFNEIASPHLLWRWINSHTVSIIILLSHNLHPILPCYSSAVGICLIPSFTPLRAHYHGSLIKFLPQIPRSTSTIFPSLDSLSSCYIAEGIFHYHGNHSILSSFYPPSFSNYIYIYSLSELANVNLFLCVKRYWKRYLCK